MSHVGSRKRLSVMLRLHPFRLVKAVFLVGLLALFGGAPVLAAAQTGTTYVDPAGHFSVEIPAGWIERSSGVFEHDGVTVSMLSVSAADLQSGIAAALAQVAPDMAASRAQSSRQFLAANGIFAENTYTRLFGLGKTTIAVAEGRNDRVYALIFQGPNARSIQQADVEAFAQGVTVGLPADLTGHAATPLTPAQLSAFAGYVQAQMKHYGVVGASAAIVQNGKVIFAQGFGTRTLGGAPVDVETLFMIGSTTKSMTTMMMGALVDEGKLDWNTPVVDLLPSFQLASASLTPQIRVRDLVGNATGVPRYDLPLIFERQTPDQMIASLKNIRLVSDFGKSFNYSNQMVAVGGYVAAIAAGATPDGGGQDLLDTYQTLMQQRVFDPIGMSHTTLDFDRALADANHATSYLQDIISGQTVPVPPPFEQFVLPIAPAGAIWSNASDMARYLQTELSGGVAPDGQRVISAQALAETQTPNVAISGKARYGLGWIIDDYRGLTLIQHGGNAVGYTSDFAFLPDADLGVVVLSNASAANEFSAALREYVFEEAFGIEHVGGDFYAQMQQLDDYRSRLAIDPAKLDAAAPDGASASLGSYQGGLQVVFGDGGRQLVLRTSFGDIPLYAVKQQPGSYLTGGAVRGFRVELGGDTLIVAPINLNDAAPTPAKIYKKLS